MMHRTECDPLIEHDCSCRCHQRCGAPMARAGRCYRLSGHIGEHRSRYVIENARGAAQNDRAAGGKAWRKGMQGALSDNQLGSVHHADDGMRCAACGVRWPCEPFLEARARSRVPLVVYPERTA